MVNLPSNGRSTPIDADPAPALRAFSSCWRTNRVLRILYALSRHEELHVQRICTMLGQTQPAVSHHLALMRTAGMVTMRRDGKHNFYRLDPASLRKPIHIIETMIAINGGNGEPLPVPSLPLANDSV